MKTVISCPLCAWSYEVPPLDPRITPQTLAGIFGPSIFSTHAINTQAQKTEEVLAAHFATHTVVEWLGKVTSLQRQIERLEQEVRDARYLTGMMIAEAGGRLTIHSKTMRDFDSRQSVTCWDDPVGGHRIYALQTVTSTANAVGEAR